MDPDFSSDLYALSFYKSEFEHEHNSVYPIMEVINVYNVFVERKFGHIFKNKCSPFVSAAREMYIRQYKKILQQRKDKDDSLTCQATISERFDLEQQ